MAEVFLTFADTLIGRDGTRYAAQACGGEMDDGRWQGWIEFEALDGPETLRSPRETTQPNRTDLAYWATGLTAVYLEGALERALRPEAVTMPAARPVAPAFDAPLPPGGLEIEPAPQQEAVLNPFSVYRKGETVLRQQLAALAEWHLVNIIRAYGLSLRSEAELAALPTADLIELIAAAVREDASIER